MGGAQDYLAHRTVIDEAEKAGISRMILVTSLGCGDSWPFLSDTTMNSHGWELKAAGACIPAPVSYTHLAVYKRQTQQRAGAVGIVLS